MEDEKGGEIEGGLEVEIELIAERGTEAVGGRSVWLPEPCYLGKESSEPGQGLVGS